MTPAADALPINLFPNPDTFGGYSVFELLRAAAHGRTGVDQRLVRSILERPDKSATVADLVKFAAIAAEEPLDLRADLIEIFRRFRAVEALPFYLDVIREFGDDYPDELIEAIVELGAPVVEPLLTLYNELGEENGGPAHANVAYLPNAFDEASRRILEERFPDAILVADEDGAVFGLNSASDGYNVIISPRATGFEKQLRERGYNPIMVDLSELLLGGGGIKCCTLELRGA